ncbi:MMPL family transporter [Williamsia maris]|uniref:MMPL family transporter n=1 Tax=Williamsia maris TaxID=72806 RepID=UPI0020A58216|nr:MMPL family transporter [Williamsia maris]
MPQLEQSAADKSAAIIPADLPATQALREMSRDFNAPVSTAVGAVVISSTHEIGAPESRYYSELVAKLLADKDNVAYVLDMYGNPATRDFAISPDKKAVTLTVAGQGDVGTAKAHHVTSVVRDAIASISKPPGLQAHFSGAAPTVADEFSSTDTSMLIITAISVVLITALLLLTYRSLFAAMIPLLTIGISLAVARAVVSLLGQHGVLPISSLTVTLMTALVLGAATDYAIFQLAGFHEARRRGLDPITAVITGSNRTAHVLVASALTVALSAGALVFAKIGLFTTSGPPIAVALLITLAVSLTFTPALTSILGRRTLIEPRPSRQHQWHRLGTRIIRRSIPLAALSVIVLLALAAIAVTLRPNGDDHAMQLRASDSTRGYDEVARHFPANEILPEYLVIRTDHDMRNTNDLAALEVAAAAVSQLPTVAYVRSITRPDGHPLPESAIGYQTGVIGERLADAHHRIDAARPELARLAAGVTQLRAGAVTARDQLPALVDGTKQVAAIAGSLLDLLPTATRIAHAAGTDGNNLTATLDRLQNLTGTLTQLVTTLQPSRVAFDRLVDALAPLAAPGAACPPGCLPAKQAFTALDAATHGALRQAFAAAQATQAITPDMLATVNKLLPDLRAGLTQITALVSSLDGRSPEQIRADLTRLTTGVDALSNGIGQIAEGLTQAKNGTDQTVSLTDQLAAGLDDAAKYLRTLSSQTTTGPGAGFYLPPQALTDNRFVAGSRLLISSDGHVARMLVMASSNPYGNRIIDSVGDVSASARAALEGTVLDGAEVESTGIASVTANIFDQVEKDFILFAIVAILAVFLILVFLLRSLLAPLLLVGAVALSFASAVGISVLVWQHLIGIELHWSVLPVAFMVLVAVGADYSMLFASRIREDPDTGMTRSIIRAFGTTGSVITTAGIVFAITMFALMSGSVMFLLQTGFTIGIGLLLDVAVIRTILVPTVMHLIGERVWWPAHHKPASVETPS